MPILYLHQFLVPPEAIESLITSFPLLESLALSYLDGLIRAPNLKYLCLEGEFMDICLENALLLAVMSVSMFMNDMKLLNTLSRVRAAILSRTLAITCSRLKIIELYRVSFEDTKEIRVALRLITNSPKLNELHVSLVRFRRASAEAEIIFTQDETPCISSKSLFSCGCL
ncbi:hypothetical protein SADUNF_Sadunf08G0089100 [Salix dunnii]|uniref:FBD domain-containing protein n=1 Tax=Salix dunnii TaxID=1413687 RepID=A0A835MSH9_9ROSI|nr:hypothetical protein SADUNF_Sadunf08G0089100 [Salix dunnii]